MRNIFIVDIEPLDNRYTKQWRENIPKLIKNYTGIDPVSIHGDTNSKYSAPQSGAFFDFAATVEYKAIQASRLAALFRSGQVKAGDVFLFTDAWNQTIHSLKYISELNKVPVTIIGIWHAGAYDPTDILGFTIQNKQWVKELERSFFRAIDYNLFGTQQHLDKFLLNLDLDEDKDRAKCVRCGYPLETLSDLYNDNDKENIVVFPHRLNEDKAPYVFDALADIAKARELDWQFVKTQELNMTKEEYYEYIKKCKVVFSANKHENLGIGTFECVSAGCIPVVPYKLSYVEMYPEDFMIYFPESFYETMDEYVIDEYFDRIEMFITEYDKHSKIISGIRGDIQKNFFNFDKGLEIINACIKKS